MAESNSKRKSRSDKFPLTLHKTGQYCKKIKGKLYYFGTNEQKVLRSYLEQASYLHGGHKIRPSSANAGTTIGYGFEAWCSGGEKGTPTV